MMLLKMRAFFLICLVSLLGIQARPLLEHGYGSMVMSIYGRTPTPSVQTHELSSAPALKSLDKVLSMISTYKRTTGLQVQPFSANSYGRTRSPPPPPIPASPTHYEASNGLYESPPDPFLASS